MQKIINIFILVLGILFFIFGIVLKSFDYIVYPDFFRLVALSYTFIIYSILSIRKKLNGKIFLESFRITIMLFVLYSILLLLTNLKIFSNRSYNFNFGDAMSRTEYFLMIFIAIVAIKTKRKKQRVS